MTAYTVFKQVAQLLQKGSAMLHCAAFLQQLSNAPCCWSFSSVYVTAANDRPWKDGQYIVYLSVGEGWKLACLWNQSYRTININENGRIQQIIYTTSYQSATACLAVSLPFSSYFMFCIVSLKSVRR